MAQMAEKKVGDSRELRASAATVAGALDVDEDPVFLPRPVNAVILVLDVSAAATDAADTLDVVVETRIDDTHWTPVCHFTQVLGNGGAVRHVAKILTNATQAMYGEGALAAEQTRHICGDSWRVNYVQVDANSNASFSFCVSALVM